MAGNPSIVCPICKIRPQRAHHAYCAECHREYARKKYRQKHADKPRIKELVEHGKRKEHPLYRAIQSARHRARRDGLEFDLLLWDLTVPDVCPVLGIPLDSRDLQHVPSIDRWDSSKGYTKDNVRVISFRANSIKQDATAEELRRVYEYARGQ